MNGVTPVHSNVVSDVAAKGTLNATTNIALLYKTVVATSQNIATTYAGDKAVDGSLTTRWATAGSAVNTGDSSKSADLTLTFGLPVQVDDAGIIDYGPRLRVFSVEYLAGSTWTEVYVHDGGGTNLPWGTTGTATENMLYAMDFNRSVQTTGIRLRLKRASTGDPSIWEFRLYGGNYGENIAPSATTASSSTDWGASYLASKAIDKDVNTRWASKKADEFTPGQCWLSLDYGSDQKTVSAAAFRSYGALITGYRIQYWDSAADNGNGDWVDTSYSYSGSAVPGSATSGTTGGAPKIAWTFDPVSATKFRLFINSDTANEPSLWEFMLYSPN
jgi:hypothetical protein